MTMGFESLMQSASSGSNIDLEMGDMKLQYNAALDDLRVVSASFESYMNACERYLTLCDCIEANEGMLEPAVRDFVNRNGELSSALGIDLAMEDDSQDAQKQNGEKVTEKKQGFFRRIWEAIKAFIKKILDGIGNFFHWIGSFFSPMEQQANKIAENADKIEEKAKSASTEAMHSTTNSIAEGRGHAHIITIDDIKYQYAYFQDFLEDEFFKLDTVEKIGQYYRHTQKPWGFVQKRLAGCFQFSIDKWSHRIGDNTYVWPYVKADKSIEMPDDEESLIRAGFLNAENLKKLPEFLGIAHELGKKSSDIGRRLKSLYDDLDKQVPSEEELRKEETYCKLKVAATRVHMRNFTQAMLGTRMYMGCLPSWIRIVNRNYMAD